MNQKGMKQGTGFERKRKLPLFFTKLNTLIKVLRMLLVII